MGCATITQLQKANADLEAECERLRQHNIEISLDLALLRQIDKQRDPDAYPRTKDPPRNKRIIVAPRTQE